jgi:hypothetical protein
MANEIVAPREEILGSGAGGPLPVPSAWSRIGTGLWYASGGVVVGNPTGGDKGIGALNAQTLYINGVLTNLNLYLPYTGGLMTGILTLSADPINPPDAATKRYVDSNITTINGTFGNYLPLLGGTLTGSLHLAADPTVALGAATKQYVDSKTSGVIGIPDAPSDGSTYGRNNAAWVSVNTVDAGTY